MKGVGKVQVLLQHFDGNQICDQKHFRVSEVQMIS